MNPMQKITPFLWFDGTAEEAATYYVSVFPNSKILNIMRAPGPKPGAASSVMSVTFQLGGQEFTALNGGPQYSFTPAISFFVNCQTQDEVDTLWEKLTESGQELRCGWLTDKFGVTWQIIPAVLGQMLQDKDPEKSKRVMQTMLQMNKIEIQRLKQAYDQP
jgi:predicted 3-demethylubiquinone-9 3-methyltransferase (glyoxalase superfamily)